MRDMPGTDAEATVTPGVRVGEGDIEIAVAPQGVRYERYVSFDNQGSYSSGAYRVAVGGTVNAPFGVGDIFSARLQGADQFGNFLYRFGYGMAVGSYGSKVNASITQSEYVLGRQFASLDASGVAQVTALSVVHPIIRGRFTNLLANVSAEHKALNDNTGLIAAKSTKRIDMVRLGILGNHSDRSFAGATTSFAATLSSGHLKLDAATAVLDEGNPAAYGGRTAGRFSKFNVELQRVQYFGESSSVLLGLNGQLASKNLSASEKFNLGGPQGVRGYPIGEGVGDDSVLLSAEFRFRTGFQIGGEVLSLTAFYDYGRIRRDHVRNATTFNVSTTDNSLTLDSAGIGFLLGREGNFVVTGALASRIGAPAPTTGDPDSKPRAWMLMQRWF
jgi:hemolysin activation/secretion protein